MAKFMMGLSITQLGTEEVCWRTGAVWVWPSASDKPSRLGPECTRLCPAACDSRDIRDCCGKWVVLSTDCNQRPLPLYLHWKISHAVVWFLLLFVFFFFLFFQFIAWKTGITMQGVHVLKRRSQELNTENNKSCWDYAVGKRAGCS